MKINSFRFLSILFLSLYLFFISRVKWYHLAWNMNCNQLCFGNNEMHDFVFSLIQTRKNNSWKLQIQNLLFWFHETDRKTVRGTFRHVMCIAFKVWACNYLKFIEIRRGFELKILKMLPFSEKKKEKAKN